MGARPAAIRIENIFSNHGRTELLCNARARACALRAYLREISSKYENIVNKTYFRSIRDFVRTYNNNIRRYRFRTVFISGTRSGSSRRTRAVHEPFKRKTSNNNNYSNSCNRNYKITVNLFVVETRAASDSARVIYYDRGYRVWIT